MPTNNQDKNGRPSGIPASAASAFAFTVDLRRPGFVDGEDATLEALVRLQGPARPANAPPREPLTLALVLDRSGSMAGAPLDEAKRCARSIVESLGPRDRVAIVAFDDEVDVIAPVLGVHQRAGLLAAIDAIDGGGSTDLHGGWHKGAQLLQAAMNGVGVHRVILLSDGGANVGETDLESITSACRDAARGCISTSTYGLGRNFTEDLMLAMAKAGRGNGYYGQTARDLAEPFQAEFALLTSLCARGMVLKVNAPAGVEVRLRNDYEPADGEARAWKLPDLAFDAEAWAWLEMTIPATLLHQERVQLPITVSIKAAGPASTPLFFMASLPPVIRWSVDAMATAPLDDRLERRRDELDAGDALDTVHALIAANRWSDALTAVEKAQARLVAHPWCASILTTMQKMVSDRDAFGAKEARYARDNLRRRLAARDEVRSCLAEEQDAPAFLRRKAEQGRGEPRS
ncbi:MAG: VWA domain-containing protein [Casimicrobiaceae bacterium]